MARPWLRCYLSLAPWMKVDLECLLEQRAALAAGCAEQKEKEAELELKPENESGPSQLAAHHHHPCSLPQAFIWSPLQKPASRGNVSLLAGQETSMPKQGTSWSDTALPVGYVRSFLLSQSVCLSLSHSFGRLPFSKQPQFKPLGVFACGCTRLYFMLVCQRAK